ncbi:hypothetical protein AB0C01_07290 [Micromonospora sp. NPDC048905]|uniref:hypothetical protein n=1 Tax=Micromonospora sp. NPDC048905 TaxID=3155494 RepID=UPI0033E8DD2D
MVVSLLGSMLLTSCGSGTPLEQTPGPATSLTDGNQLDATPSVTSADPNLTPHQRLMALAQSISATPADGTADLPYTYLHTQTWTRATNMIVRTDVRRWRRDADGSGQEVTRRLPDLPGVDHQPERDERKLFAKAPETLTRHRVNTLHPHLPGPLPADAETLTGALAPRELAAEPAYPRMLTGGVVGLATSQYLNREQRAASLRVLATVPQIKYLGKTTDLAGRPGLGFSVTADGSTSQLVIDPNSGEILAAQERVTGRRPGLFSYVLILERGHTASTRPAAYP